MRTLKSVGDDVLRALELVDESIGAIEAARAAEDDEELAKAREVLRKRIVIAKSRLRALGKRVRAVM
jgi:hypothetical protein